MPSLTETVVGAVVALALREGTPLLWKAYKNRRIEPKKAEQQYLLDVAAWFADRAKRLCDIRLMLKASIIQRSPLFFVRYKGSAGDALSPAPVALVVSVTNTRQVPVTLDGISIDAREASSRGRIKLQKWKKLQYVPSW
jgi:hypothetical protein